MSKELDAIELLRKSLITLQPGVQKSKNKAYMIRALTITTIRSKPYNYKADKI